MSATRVAAGEAVLWPAGRDARRLDRPFGTMRAFVVEFAGADDAAFAGILEGAALRDAAGWRRGRPGDGTLVRRPATASRSITSRRAALGPRAGEPAQHRPSDRPELAEDPGGRAPHVEAVDPVRRRSGAASRGSSARRSRSGRPGRKASTGGVRIRATSAGAATSRSARGDRDDRRDPEVADRDEDLSSGPMTRTPAAAASSPTSSAASRRAVAAGPRRPARPCRRES